MSPSLGLEDILLFSLSVSLMSAPRHENCSSYLHETSYKYQSTLDDMQSARTITLAFILFELFALGSVTKSCPLYNLKTVQAIFKKLHINIRTLEDVQSTKTIILAFILFELFSLDSVTKSCLLYKLKTVQAIFMKLLININQH